MVLSRDGVGSLVAELDGMGRIGQLILATDIRSYFPVTEDTGKLGECDLRSHLILYAVDMDSVCWRWHVAIVR